MISIKENVLGLFGGIGYVDENMKNQQYLNDFFLFNVGKKIIKIFY